MAEQLFSAMRFIFFLIFACITSLSFAQTEDKQSNSFEPFTPQTTKAKQKQLKEKTTKKKSLLRLRLFNKRMESKKEEFWQRMETNAKHKKKIAKKMEKPQYSDPMYFGHKKKPKKRPPGKRKFCKECGITH